jgi:universal stress protein E
VNRIRSILVIAERSAELQSALHKACVIARHFDAQVELFACDAEHAWQVRDGFERRVAGEAVETAMADSRRLLDAIRASIAAEDLQITTSVACESPQYEGILRKVRESQPDLVIKCVAALDPTRRSALGATDWQMIRTCPAPLLLTRGRTWLPQPRVAASIDISAAESPAVTRRVLVSADYIARGCAGELDVVYSDAGGMLQGARRLLRRFTADVHVHPARIEVLAGPPELTLAGFARQREVDVMVLGALGHAASASGSMAAAAIGTLTEALLEQLECDFLLVGPEGNTDGSTRQVAAPSVGRRTPAAPLGADRAHGEPEEASEHRQHRGHQRAEPPVELAGLV